MKIICGLLWALSSAFSAATFAEGGKPFNAGFAVFAGLLAVMYFTLHAAGQTKTGGG